MTEQLTAQEWFDRTVAHLRSMPKRSAEVNNHGFTSCKYLAADGNKCVIGVHIPEGHPGQDHDWPVDSLVDEHPDLTTLVLPDAEYAMDLGLDMQSVHDSERHWNDDGFHAEDRLAGIAARYGLTLAPKG